MSRSAPAALGTLLLLSWVGAAASADEDYYAKLSKELGLDPADDIRKDPGVVAEARRYEAILLARKQDYAGLDAHLAAFPEPAAWTSADAVMIPQLYQRLAAWFAQSEGAWLKARPKSADAHFVQGMCTLQRAWAARGSGYANTVKEDGWKVWRKLIPIAKAQTDKALELDPKHPLALAQRLKIDRCISAPQEVFEEHFAEAVAAAGTVYEVYEEALWFNLPRWGGTWARCWKMIAKLSERSPGHETRLRILVEAHIMRANELGKTEDQIKAYFQQEAIKTAIQEAITAVREGSPTSWVPALQELDLYPYLGLPAERVNRVALEAAQRGHPRWTQIVIKNWLPNLAQLPEGNRAWLMRFLFQGTLAGNARLQDQIDEILIGSNPQRPLHPAASYYAARVLGANGFDQMRGRAIELLRRGIGVEQDEAGAVAEHRAQADAGSAACAFHYGMIRYMGSSSTEQDRELGLRYVTRSAQQRFPLAYVGLARIHLGRYGGPVDLDEAEKWLGVAERARMPQARELRAALQEARAKK